MAAQQSVHHRSRQLKKAAEEKLAEQAKEQQKPLKERLKEKFAAVRSSIRVNVMNVKPYIVEITLGSIVLLAALGSLMVLYGRLILRE